MQLLLRKKDKSDWSQEEKDDLTLGLMKAITVDLKATPQTIRIDRVSLAEISEALGHNEFDAEEVESIYR